MSTKKVTKHNHRSTSQTRKTMKQPEWDSSTEVIVHDEDLQDNSKNIPPKSKQSRTSSMSSGNTSLDKRPPFNLDTHIEGYDDVDENGKYRKKQSEAAMRAERKKQQINQAELNQQWSESLRENFY